MEKMTMADEPDYTDPTLSLDERIASAEYAARAGDPVAFQWATQLKVRKAAQQTPDQSNWDPATAMTADGTAEEFEARRQQFLQDSANSLMLATSPLDQAPGEVEGQPRPGDMPGITAGRDPVDLTSDGAIGLQQQIEESQAAWRAHQDAQISQGDVGEGDTGNERKQPLDKVQQRFQRAQEVAAGRDDAPSGRAKAQGEGRWADSFAEGFDSIPRTEPYA